VNAGIGDVGLREEIDILEETGVQVEPDVVVLAFYLNDSRPPWGFPETLQGRGWLRRYSVLADKIYREAALGRWLRDTGEDRFGWTRQLRDPAWRTNREAFLRLAHAARYDWGAAWEEGSWARVDPELARLRGLSERHGFRVAVVLFPVRYQALTRFIENAPQRRIRGQAEALGWPVLDLLPLAREEGAGFFFDTCHPTSQANDRIGRALAEFLRERVLDGGPTARELGRFDGRTTSLWRVGYAGAVVTQIPVQEGLYTGPPESPQLVASRCTDCAEVTFPKQDACPHCTGRSVEEIPLSRRGKLWTWTVQHFPPPAPPYAGPADRESFVPFGVGYVELAEGVRVEGRLTESDPARLQIGMDMELVLEKFLEDAEGNDLLTFAFRPVRG
jgi:uncharacterized OB-fold protein